MSGRGRGGQIVCIIRGVVGFSPATSAASARVAVALITSDGSMPRERVGPGKTPCASGEPVRLSERISKWIESMTTVAHGRQSRCSCAAACNCREHMSPRATLFKQDENPEGPQLDCTVLIKLTITARR